jgi:hypothetical protein
MPRRLRWLILTLGLIPLTACALLAAPAATSISATATSESTLSATTIPPSALPTGTTSSVSTATSAVAAATGGQVPSSCSALESLVGTYIGGVATTKSLGSPKHLSCEYANAKASNIVIVDIGEGGTAAAFDTLRTSSAKGGRTVTAIGGLGASAFSVSKNGKPAGVSVLTAQGIVYVVESNLSIDQDEALIKQLMMVP